MSDSSKDRTPERVQAFPLNQIDDFPDNPFLVKDDDSMEQLIHSIEMNGVLNPVIARQKEDGRGKAKSKSPNQNSAGKNPKILSRRHNGKADGGHDRKSLGHVPPAAKGGPGRKMKPYREYGGKTM